MFHSDTIPTSALTFRLDAGVNRIAPAARRSPRPADPEDRLHAQQRVDLRRRLLDMIIRNEQLRKLRPR
jgi:hypothetical protein